MCMFVCIWRAQGVTSPPNQQGCLKQGTPKGGLPVASFCYHKNKCTLKRTTHTHTHTHTRTHTPKWVQLFIILVGIYVRQPLGRGFFTKNHSQIGACQHRVTIEMDFRRGLSTISTNRGKKGKGTGGCDTLAQDVEMLGEWPTPQNRG